MGRDFRTQSSGKSERDDALDVLARTHFTQVVNLVRTSTATTTEANFQRDFTPRSLCSTFEMNGDTSMPRLQIFVTRPAIWPWC